MQFLCNDHVSSVISVQCAKTKERKKVAAVVQVHVLVVVMMVNNTAEPAGTEVMSGTRNY